MQVTAIVEYSYGVPNFGEMVALQWGDFDFHPNGYGQIAVERSAWKGQIGLQKGGRIRFVPMTRRLAAALHQHRHQRGPRVMYQEDGNPMTEKVVQNLVGRAARGADLRHNGPHMLRYTFCSHLAMRGASAKQIQELAGHQDLGNDSTLHASESCGDRCGHRPARRTGACVQPWRHCGDGQLADGQRAQVEQDSWCRRRESNPHGA